jgi:uncharacterized membrane protein
MILPVVGLAVLWGQRRRSLGKGAWWVVVALAGIFAGSSLVALKTGEAEEDRVEDIVADDAIHTHEERAESLTWLAAGVFAITLLAGVTRNKVRTALSISGVGLAGITMLVALSVGHSGGSLVYEHGAAAAYTSAPVNELGRVVERSSGHGRQDHDEDDEGHR